MWNKDEQETSPAQAVHPSSAARKQTRIGASVALRGTLQSEEDLLLEGRLDGEIHVPNHKVSIGRTGRIKADVQARVIEIEGRVAGDLKGGERVVVAAAGHVEGNIKAPRVSLENGAQFRGSIDMDPASGAVESEAGGAARKGPKPAESPPVPSEKTMNPKPGASAAGS